MFKRQNSVRCGPGTVIIKDFYVDESRQGRYPRRTAVEIDDRRIIIALDESRCLIGLSVRLGLRATRDDSRNVRTVSVRVFERQRVGKILAQVLIDNPMEVRMVCLDSGI
jgi:hypothetical protein